ncbi:putative DNA-invertase from lambdoid prophage Rac [compost metagenome]
MNAIIYSRVSTDEQAEKGFSLRHQKQVLQTYCGLNKICIVKHFEDDFSAKNFNRPEWKNLMDYVAKNKKQIDKVLFTKWDRFSRNAEEAHTVIRKFSAMGIEVNSIEQPLDLTNPDNKVMLAMYLILPEVENDKISQRTKDGMRRAMKEGCFLAKAPYGYTNAKILGKTSVVPNEQAEIVLQAFTEVAKGLEAVEIIRQRFKAELGLSLQKQQFYNMLRNDLYRGKVSIPEYKKESAEVIDGIHKAIVSNELFKIVQDVLDGRKNTGAKFPSAINEDFPVKANLFCPVCGRQITGSKSKGNGGYYEYYHCKAKCGIRHKKQFVHDSIKKRLDEVSLSDNAKELYSAILTDVITANQKDAQKRILELDSELTSVRQMIIDAEDRFMAKEIELELFNRVTRRYHEKVSDLENRIANLGRDNGHLKKYIGNSVKLLCNMGDFFNRLPQGKKGSFLRTIYPENLVLEKEGVRTNSENVVLELLTRIDRNLKKLEMKKATPKSGFSNLAPPLGLEPRTL